jgi:hypothetical protein
MRKYAVALMVAGLVMVAAFSAMGAIAQAGSGKNQTVQQPNVKVNEPAPEKPIADAKWTVMVYLDGDNNLETYAMKDLAELEKVGSKNGVNVIVLMDTLTLLSGTHWYFIGEGVKHVDLANGTNDCDCAEIAGACPGELNMGDGATLTYFVRTAMAYAPAENYMLVMWDHGGGWYGVCWDDSSLLPDGRSDRLTVDELGNALVAALDGTGKRLSIIGYDACLNSMIEVAYENRKVADYMVASVTMIPGDGWSYDGMLEKLTADPTVDAPTLGKIVVDTYIDYYSVCAGSGTGGMGSVELGVLDLAKVEALAVGAGGINDLANALMPYASISSYRGAIESAESQTPMLELYGEAFAFIDIGHFATLLGQKIPELKSLTDSAFELLEAAVLYHRSVSTAMGPILDTNGLTIYFTCSWYYLYEDYGYDTYEESEAAGALPYYGMDFAADTSWDEFLMAFSVCQSGA